LVEDFLVVLLSFLVVSVDFLVVEDFLVVDVLAGDFSGIVELVSVLLVLVQAPMRPAANRAVNE
jgi:hypothetical protein